MSAGASNAIIGWSFFAEYSTAAHLKWKWFGTQAGADIGSTTARIQAGNID
jgi:hypothetical protein